MKIEDLRPGHENVNLVVKIVRLEEPRKILTSYDVTHNIVEGEVEDETGIMNLTVWNDLIQDLKKIRIGNIVELKNCFITSFKGVLSINVGRNSEIKRISHANI
jgi:ssDNA-binding replication factor A large subunit